MSIFQVDMLTGLNKVETAIALLKACEPPDGYYGAFSGGKDSCVIKHLTQQAGVKADWHYCVSPIDPKEIHDFIKQYHPDVQWDYHARGFFKKVLTNGLPTRRRRWCCRLIKEAGGNARVKILGMRHAESTTRKLYKCFETPKHKDSASVWVMPILHWSGGEVWEYIGIHNIKVCSLYAEGFERIGCVLCPFLSRKLTAMQLIRFPKLAKAWYLAAVRYFYKRIERGTPLPFSNPDEYWLWWISRDAKRRDKRQGEMIA
ncbi:MAG: phosphoadenosine phosphosulfate reductase [Dehalococcoidia bacterium]|nr:MAG: phosphoadenosine phosphosulfate reductase [Dehalococcoidia bacterium]